MLVVQHTILDSEENQVKNSLKQPKESFSTYTYAYVVLVQVQCQSAYWIIYSQLQLSTTICHSQIYASLYMHSSSKQGVNFLIKGCIQNIIPVGIHKHLWRSNIMHMWLIHVHKSSGHENHDIRQQKFYEYCSLHLHFWSILSKCCKHMLLYLRILKNIHHCDSTLFLTA